MRKIKLEQLSDSFCIGDKSKFSEALSNLIRAYGISYVSRTAHINRMTLWRYMKGDQDMTISNLIKILKAIGVNTCFEVEMDTPTARRFMDTEMKQSPNEVSEMFGPDMVEQCSDL